jgi:DNA-binding Lrp family transcriptional regulator
MSQSDFHEKIHITGAELEARVKELLHEGNVRHIVIKHDEHTVLEIPVTVGVVTVVLAPLLVAVGALGAALTHCTIEVERVAP